MLALFEGESSYPKNAESAGQHRACLTLRSMLEAGPEWYDIDEMQTMVHEQWVGRGETPST